MVSQGPQNASPSAPTVPLFQQTALQAPSLGDQGDVVRSYRPSAVSNVPFSMLEAIDQQALREAVYVVFNGHSPQTLNHRGAVVVFQDFDGGYFFGKGVNVDTAMRGKNCAEPAALRAATQPYQRIAAVVTVSWRNNGGPGDEPPVAPCGSCRDDLLAGLGRDYGRPGVDAQTRLVMAPTNFESVQVVTMGELLPLHFSPVPVGAERLNQMGLPSLRLLDRAELQGHSEQLSLPPEALGQLIKAAEAAASQSVAPISGPVGAAVLSTDGKIFTGRRFDAVNGRGGKAAEIDAIQGMVSEIGTSMFEAVAITSRPGATSMLEILPSGEALQTIFHFAQVSGRDLPIVICLPGTEQILIVRVSEIFPLGEGPLDSSSMAKNTAKYRVVGGKQVP